jgi:branched-chain amino acid transport system substrate-binding protein
MKLKSSRWFALAISAFFASSLANAADVFKVGIITTMSGPFAEWGKQMETGVKVYLQEHGDTVAGRKIQVTFRDDGGANPEVAKRLAQELIVRDKVNVLGGFVYSPNAFAVGSIATMSKTPVVVMNAAAGALMEASPYFTRTAFSLPNLVPPMSEWMVKQGYKTSYSLVPDYSAGIDVEKALVDSYAKAGGTLVGSTRTPIVTLDFSPYMQKMKDAKPSTVFAFVNGADVAAALMKEFKQKDLGKSGTVLTGTGDIVDEQALRVAGDAALGTITVYPYSADHASSLNEKFVRQFEKMRPGERPTIMAVAAYDGMALIYEALRKTRGKADGTGLLEAMKGVKLESPRGPIEIDAATRDIKQRMYIRKVERVGGRLANVEFATVEPK